MASESVEGLAPLLILLAILIFAALAWCMISSCLGQSMGDLWRALVLSGQSGNTNQPWKRGRSGWMEAEYEMEYRGRGRAA